MCVGSKTLGEGERESDRLGAAARSDPIRSSLGMASVGVGVGSALGSGSGSAGLGSFIYRCGAASSTGE